MISVVDTNVLVAANRHAPQATPSCIVACVDRLVAIQTGGTIAVDDGWRIVREYQQHMSRGGQPGVGDAFLKWLLTNARTPGRVEWVQITARGEDGDFEEFPDATALEGFDLADRKFVAVARVCRDESVILNATDSDWWHFREPLGESGVQVEFLCPELMTQGAARRPRV